MSPGRNFPELTHRKPMNHQCVLQISNFAAHNIRVTYKYPTHIIENSLFCAERLSQTSLKIHITAIF